MDDIKQLKDELEALKKVHDFETSMHTEEIREVKHNGDLVALEMRNSWMAEKERALEEQKIKLEEMYKKQIDEVKRKQWCAGCLKEAIYFCCWNTSCKSCFKY